MPRAGLARLWVQRCLPIERRAYALYEVDGFKDGSDQEHWFRAEKELTIQNGACSIEDDEVTIRIPMEGFPASIVLISISACSALILGPKEDSSNRPGVIDSDFLRVVSLPVEVDATRVTGAFDGDDLILTVPAGTNIPMSARTACA
jgi:Protein of unknown function (DUF2934)